MKESGYLGFLVPFLSLLQGCQSSTQQQFNAQKFSPAFIDSPQPVKTVKEYVPVAMPGQLMPVPTVNELNQTPEAKTKEPAVNTANDSALIYPKSSDFINSMAVYPYMKGSLYVIYAAPLQLTDIEFQPGESVVSIASGDSSRWMIGKTYSGSDSGQTWHLLVKPTTAQLKTGLDVMTDRRSYHIELISTEKTYLASVRWDYPNEEWLKQEKDDSNGLGSKGSESTSNPLKIDMTHVDFNYTMQTIQGDKPNWFPTQVFNDGIHTYIQFPDNINSDNMPILLVAQNPSKQPSFKNPSFSPMVNYRVKGQYIIVDSVIQSAELKTGVNADRDRSDNQTIVWIHR